MTSADVVQFFRKGIPKTAADSSTDDTDSDSDVVGPSNGKRAKVAGGDVSPDYRVKIPINIVCVGASRGGKTVKCMDMITGNIFVNEDDSPCIFDIIVVYSQRRDESQYAPLRQYCKQHRCKLVIYHQVTVETLTDNKTFDEDAKMAVLIEDQLLQKAAMVIIQSWYVSDWRRYKAVTFFTSQKYFGPEILLFKTNSEVLIVFPLNGDAAQLKILLARCSTTENKSTVAKIIAHLSQKKEDGHFPCVIFDYRQKLALDENYDEIL